MSRTIRDIRMKRIAENSVRASVIAEKFIKEGYRADVTVDNEIAQIYISFGDNTKFFRVLLPDNDEVNFCFNRIKDQIEHTRNIYNMEEALD